MLFRMSSNFVLQCQRHTRLFSKRNDW